MILHGSFYLYEVDMKRKRTRNPVASNMEKFNRPTTHKDRTKYDRSISKKITKTSQEE